MYRHTIAIPVLGRDADVFLGLSDWLNSKLAGLVSIRSINNAVPKTNKEAQWLRALVLAEVPSLIPITHTGAEEHPVPPIPRMPSSDLLSHQTPPMAHTIDTYAYTCSYTHPCDF